jgi:hypothetical protein
MPVARSIALFIVVVLASSLSARAQERLRARCEAPPARALQVGRAHLRAERLELAVACLDVAHRREPEGPATAELGLAYLAVGDLVRATAFIEAALDRARGHAADELHFHLGRIAELLGDLPGAIQHYGIAQNNGPHPRALARRIRLERTLRARASDVPLSEMLSSIVGVGPHAAIPAEASAPGDCDERMQVEEVVPIPGNADLRAAIVSRGAPVCGVRLSDELWIRTAAGWWGMGEIGVADRPDPERAWSLEQAVPGGPPEWVLRTTADSWDDDSNVGWASRSWRLWVCGAIGPRAVCWVSLRTYESHTVNLGRAPSSCFEELRSCRDPDRCHDEPACVPDREALADEGTAWHVRTSLGRGALRIQDGPAALRGVHRVHLVPCLLPHSDPIFACP